jgi:hypothetical protein
MALEGTIKDFGLPDIFQLIGLQRKTGILTLKNQQEQVTVTFENGMVVMADSSGKRLEDRLGNVLVKQGKLTKERLDEVLQTQKATLQRLGHVLVTNSFISGKDLKDALHVQVSQIVFRLFRWREGEYHFAPTESVDFDRENFNPMSADFILMEGIRMVDEWPIIEKKIPSMDLVFRSVVDPTMIEIGGGEAEESLGALAEPKRAAASSTNKIRLTPEEERIFRRIDGTRTVQAIIDSTGMGDFEVCRTLFDMLNRNLITPAGRGPSREASRFAREEDAEPVRAPAFAMIGLAAALSLAGLFAQMSSPFAVLGLPPLRSSYDPARSSYELMIQAVSHARLQRLDRALYAYYLARGSLPETLEVLADAGLVDRSYLNDARNSQYRYRRSARSYELSVQDDRGNAAPGTVIERVLPADR